ncbi:MAG: ABC transporter permease [Deltaproteobacteria bacterium]|nr:MAG: ABC transporter permease [Deltaproteobacteria bacterium]
MKSFNNVGAIFKREIAGYFGSPVAYVFIVIFLVLLGFFTFYISRFFEVGQADLRNFFEWHPWIFLFLIPAVAMRLWSEERRMGTIELILTFPITLAEAILGKFLAAWAFIGIALFLTFPMVITVTYLGSPDIGPVFCAYLGSFLSAGAFLSVGIMTSSFTRSQVISFILSVIICLFFILAGYPPVTDVMAGWAPNWMLDLISNLGFLSHSISIERGVLDFRDLLYYFSVIFFMLFVNGIVIQNRKAS